MKAKKLKQDLFAHRWDLLSAGKASTAIAKSMYTKQKSLVEAHQKHRKVLGENINERKLGKKREGSKNDLKQPRQPFKLQWSSSLMWHEHCRKKANYNYK